MQAQTNIPIMKKIATTYVDKLCLKSIFLCVAGKACLNIGYIQKRKPLILNYLYIFLLMRFGIRVKHYPLNKISGNYKNVFNITDKCIERLISAKNTATKKSLELLIDQKIAEHYFAKVWRLFSILIFLEDKYKNVGNVYIGVDIPKSVIKKVEKFISDENFSVNILLYKSYAISDESNFLHKNNTGFIKKMVQIFWSARLLILSPKLALSRHGNIDLLLFSHENVESNDSFNPASIVKELKGVHALVAPMSVVKFFGTKQVSKKLSIRFGSVLRYYCIFYRTLSQKLKIPIYLSNFYITIQVVHKYSFLKVYLEDCNIKVVYSFYESLMAQSAVAAAEDLYSTVSLSSTWSLGYFPSSSITTFRKLSDRFLIWGEWHYHIMKRSLDASRGYIFTGYPGINFNNNLVQQASDLRTKLLKKNDKIIAYYDTTIAEDLFFDESKAILILNKLVKLSRNSNAIIIFKCKKKLHNKIKRICDENQDVIMINNEQSSLIPSFAADISIGILNSTLVSVAAEYGRQSYFINCGNVMSEQWNILANNFVEFIDVEEIDESLFLDAARSKKSLGAVDYFQDGNCHKRTRQYLDSILNNMNNMTCKEKVLECADQSYISEHGKDTVRV